MDDINVETTGAQVDGDSTVLTGELTDSNGDAVDVYFEYAKVDSGGGDGGDDGSDDGGDTTEPDPDGITLAPGESHTETLTWTADTAGSYVARVSSDDDAAEQTVEVTEPTQTDGGTDSGGSDDGGSDGTDDGGSGTPDWWPFGISYGN